MNYQETLEYIYAKLPALDKIGWGAYKPGLERIYEQLELLSNPQNNFKTIHVAGTNGKGSVSNLLASILQESGFKVGLFTSPHLQDFRERIRVNGFMISEKKVIDYVAQFSDELSVVSPSFFEYTFAMAMSHFSEEQVDFAVVETGLGGRLDCSNVVNPILSIITNVAFDHEQFLGDTLQKIAFEKAGIIKKNVPVVVGRFQEETSAVFKEKTTIENSDLIYAKSNFYYPCALTGDCQKENQATVLTSVNELRKMGVKILESEVARGLLNVLTNTGFQGRFQIVQENPLIVCDVAHNEEGVQQLVTQINKISKGNLKIVWGMSADKKISKILSFLPTNATYFWCEASHPRALNCKELKSHGTLLKLNGQPFTSVKDAFFKAKQELEPNDVLLVAGSVFVVADFLNVFNSEQIQPLV